MGRIFDTLNESEDYLLNVNTTDFSAVTSYVECALGFVNEMNEGWNQSIREMYLKELAVLESTGSEIVLEAADGKSFLDTIKNWFTSLWARVAGMIKKWVDAIDAKRRDNTKFVKENKDAFEAGAKLIPADGIKIKGYKYTGLDKAVDNIKAALNDVDKDSTFEEIITADGTYGPMEKETIAKYVSDTKEKDAAFKESYLKKIGIEDGNIKTYNASLKKLYFGEEITSISASEINTKQIMDDVSNAAGSRNLIKAAYTVFKNDINNQIKLVEGWKKNIAKGDGLVSMKMAAINSHLVPIRFTKTITATAYGIILQACAAKLKQDKEVMKKVAALVPKEKKVVGESSTADFESALFGLDLL